MIMKIAYGHQIDSDDDEYIKMTENVSLAHVDAGDPGTAPVDFFPSRTLTLALRLGNVVCDTRQQCNTSLGGSRAAGSTVSCTVSSTLL